MTKVGLGPAVAVLLLCGCSPMGGEAGGEAVGEPATWEVDTQRPPRSEDRRVAALVSRLECANGVTGLVLEPSVDEADDRIVVTFTVENTPDEDASCPGNRPVLWTLSLERALGDRQLLDGTCLPARRGEPPDCTPRLVWPPSG